LTDLDVGTAPPPGLLFRRRVGLREAAREFWARRALVASIAERELRVRYKRAFLGAGWAVVTPVTLMIAFTLLFRHVAKIDTGGAPYALFAYLGLLPWTFFASSVSDGSGSLLANGQLLNKVYCPREVFPAASILVAAADFTVATAVLGVLFGIETFAPHATAVWVPLYLALQVLFTAGVVLALSGAFVYLRDLRHVLPIVLQVGLFATPVAYGLEKVPERFRLAAVVVNPLAEVIDGYRRSLLYGHAPDWPMLGAASASALVVFLVGWRLFKRLETGIADVA
jgi:ABC-type polysaccharide/polyol phosphate export permease